MANAKFVKTAAAVALGASVVTTAVAPGAASAATKYKVNSKGNLVLKSTGSLVKGWVEFGGKLYKNGKPAPAKKYKIMGTGASMKLYFGPGLKKGYKTANSKSLLFKDGKLLKGNKQTADRTRYYENGKLATGWDVVAADETKYIYKSGKLFKEPKTATRDGVLNYFENGKLAEGTKAFQDTLFTDGTVDEKDQVFEDVLYVGGKKAEGTVTFEDVVYIDGVKDTEKPEITAEDKTVEYGSEAVDVATLATVKDNSGEEIKAEAKISFDGKAVEKIDTKIPGVYTVTFTAKDKNGNEAEAKEVKVTVAPAKEATVETVKALDATTLVIKFSKELNKEEAEKAVVTLEGVSFNKKALSEDGKTLTLTSTKAIDVKDAKIVVPAIQVKDNAKETSVAYTSLFSYADTVAPSIAGVEQLSSTQAKVNFSEALTVATSNFSFAYADGTALKATPKVTVATDKKSATIDLSNKDIEVGKEIKVTLVGAKDVAENIITPNPATFSVTKAQADGVLPAVNSITQTGAKTFEVSFSKSVKAGTVKVNNVAVTLAPKTEGATTDTTFVATSTTVLDGVQNVVLSGFADIDSQKIADTTKVVTFVKDEVAPKVTASELVKVNGAENIKLTFDKAVSEGKVKVNGTSVKDFVTTNLTETTVDAKYPADDKSKKVLLVPVASFVAGEGAKYDLKLTSETIKSDAEQAMEEATVSFTSAGNDAPSTENENVFASKDITVAQGATPSEVTVTFNKEVDGASATNIANYAIDGAVVESATLAGFANKKQVVTLKLKAGSNTFTGVRNITVSNVKVKNSTKVMEPAKYTNVSLAENVAATVASAKLVANNTIEVTFSEDVNTPDNVKVVSGTDELATTKVATTATGKVVTVTLDTAVTADQLKAGLLVNVDVKDANGNVTKVEKQAVAQ